MTTLYRTPNLILDVHEWHVIVWKKNGSTSVSYRWRPIATRTVKWRSISVWEGKRPKSLWRFFRPYRRHIQFAMGCETRRAEAVRAGERKAAAVSVRVARPSLPNRFYQPEWALAGA